MGTENYITKHISRDEMPPVIDREFETKQLVDENLKLQAELSPKYSYNNIIGASSEMQKVYSMIDKASNYTANVIIYGETGTGKELVAKAIHLNSERKNEPLIIINCASIPESLLESELFGYSKGAFTGATHEKKGLFEAANKGSIFLDEIGEMSMTLQVKILRVIEEREIDVRIIAATNKDLLKAVKNNEFRSDLFYRLHVLPIYLPKLMHRVSDIPILIDHFQKKHANDLNPDGIRLSAKSLDLLLKYTWPGNVRELENIIRRCIIFSDKRVISQRELRSYFDIESDMVPQTEEALGSLEYMEKQHIINILKLSMEFVQKHQSIKDSTQHII